MIGSTAFAVSVIAYPKRSLIIRVKVCKILFDVGNKRFNLFIGHFGIEAKVLPMLGIALKLKHDIGFVLILHIYTPANAVSYVCHFLYLFFDVHSLGDDVGKHFTSPHRLI